MGEVGYQKQSSNLKKRLKDAKIAQEGAWKSAFIDVYDSELPNAKKTLKREAKTAIKSTKEFDNTLFTIPFFRILEMDELYVVIPNEKTKRVWIFIDIEKYAGNVNEYFEAVELAKTQGGFGKEADPDKASIFWRDNIYKPAREASVGRPSKQGSLQRQQYWTTIALRVGNMAEKAPWWYILEHGNNFIAKGEGQPYPSHGAQRFVEISERIIQEIFNQAIDFTYENYLERIVEEGIDSVEVVEQIEAVVTEVTENPGEYHSGDIIRQIIDRGRKYKLYISRTGELGFTLRPRF